MKYFISWFFNYSTRTVECNVRRRLRAWLALDFLGSSNIKKNNKDICFFFLLELRLCTLLSCEEAVGNSNSVTILVPRKRLFLCYPTHVPNRLVSLTPFLIAHKGTSDILNSFVNATFAEGVPTLCWINRIS